MRRCVISMRWILVGAGFPRPSSEGGETPPLQKDFLHHHARVDGGPFVAAVVEVGEVKVIEAHEVQDGGVEVVDMIGLVDGAEADFVGGADDAGFYAAAGHPHGE